ncbi:hypothetical protein FACS1894187_23870 [Synergistales bacterium]|nr:hypothetical protein FACS1894187_23870 [Synergistales bacterium]
MKAPEISPNFTIEDIHKIREYNEERRASMSEEEFSAEIHASAVYAEARIREARERRLAKTRVKMEKVV